MAIIIALAAIDFCFCCVNYCLLNICSCMEFVGSACFWGFDVSILWFNHLLNWNLQVLSGLLFYFDKLDDPQF